MTDLEILADSINKLGAINVSVDQIERVAIPILNVRNNLIALYNAVSNKAKELAAAGNEASAEDNPEGEEA